VALAVVLLITALAHQGLLIKVLLVAMVALVQLAAVVAVLGSQVLTELLE
jgi:hypothetical protein